MNSRPIKLDVLQSWTRFDNPALKSYSGTLEYTREFDLGAGWLAGRSGIVLAMGKVHELAEVELNGQRFNPLWKPPFNVEVSGAVRSGRNELRVRVTNFWPNRIIGDQLLPPEQRVTGTNIRKLTGETSLMDSGLIGPVRLRPALTTQS